MWRDNYFVTLTYNDAHVPRVNGRLTLRPRDFVLFMKKLRKLRPGVRFLQAGEYGSKGRPHHHALLFNCRLDDLEVFGVSKTGVLYRSRFLERLWPFGFSSVGTVTSNSASYVARYTLKKIIEEGGSPGGGVEPEYMTMSRKPGIGRMFLDRYLSDIYPHDRVVMFNGVGDVVLSKPPRYYDEVYSKINPEGYARIKRERVSKIVNSEICGSRLLAKQDLCRRQIDDYLIRGLE